MCFVPNILVEHLPELSQAVKCDERAYFQTSCAINQTVRQVEVASPVSSVGRAWDSYSQLTVQARDIPGSWVRAPHRASLLFSFSRSLLSLFLNFYLVHVYTLILK